MTSSHHQPLNPWFSIITCSYNRAHTLPKCYECLKALKKPVGSNGEEETFEWIIIDDGSTDGTDELVKQWIEEDIIPIRYHYQPNQGKHVASNYGINMARGYAIMEYDSDDLILPDTLTIFYDEWYKLPAHERATIKGVTARCIDSTTGKIIGPSLPHSPFIVSPQDMRFKYHIGGEMMGFTLRSIMLEYQYPVYDNSTKFCPESIVIFSIGMKYREAVIDKPVRVYVTNSNDAITKGSSRNRAAQNYYLWNFEVNNLVTKYFFSAPKDMLKALVGVTMDGFRTRRSLGTVLKGINSWKMKILVALLSPAGYILSKI